MPTWRTRGHVVLFGVFAVITILTNKYVLSILKFTYPTIFQSWQTGTIALFLLTLHSLGYINLDLSVSRSTLVSWFPAAVFFTGMIYSGSVALSRLPIPVFCSIQYVAFIGVYLADVFINNKALQSLPIISLFFTAISSMLIPQSDPKADHMGYKWMMLHCLCKALYNYTDNSLKYLKLSEMNKIFYNASISVLILMAISVVTGELYKVLEFPFLYTRTFHIGCLASGMFGSILGIQRTTLISMDYKPILPVINSVNKIVVSAVSLFIFQADFTVAMTLSVMVGLTSGLLYFFTTSNVETVKDIQKNIQIT